MPVEIKLDGQRMVAALSGEIDHHNALFVREQIDEALVRLRPPTLCLDFDAVSFMDSSAVGLVMGRYRGISAYGGALEVVNLSPSSYRVMKLSGLQALAILKEKRQEKQQGVTTK
ncbi:MAG: anti-sigma factor antagonist [Oscillospiraceae bacterium]|nr:anti-sigma factor antagonist [Oscillospiraceae bacterium]